MDKKLLVMFKVLILYFIYQPQFCKIDFGVSKFIEKKKKKLKERVQFAEGCTAFRELSSALTPHLSLPFQYNKPLMHVFTESLMQPNTTTIY